MHLAHKVVRLEHAAHGVGQRECHGHGEAFGDSHDDKGHGNHECLEEICQETYPLEIEAGGGEIHYHTANDNEGCHSIAYLGDEVAQAVKLLVERGLDAVIYLCGLEHLAVLGLVADGYDLHYAVSLHHLCATHGVVRGEGGILVKFLRVGGLVAYRLACQCGLVYVEGHGLDELTVGRYLLARVENHDVAYDHILARNLDGVAVAYHLYGLVIVDLVEQGELLVGLELEYEREAGGEKDGYEDTDGFEEYAEPFVKAIIFVE